MRNQFGVREHVQAGSVNRALGVIGDRWTLLVLGQAFLGYRRFDDFLTETGIARSVLASRLRRMVDDGLDAPRRYRRRQGGISTDPKGARPLCVRPDGLALGRALDDASARPSDLSRPQELRPRQPARVSLRIVREPGEALRGRIRGDEVGES